MSLEHRQHIVGLIGEAVVAGARLFKTCETLEIDTGTYRRWQKNGEVVEDGRPGASRPEPANKLTVKEREMILLTCNLPEFRSSPPSQIVPLLADQGLYRGSESSFYRVLHEANQQHDRGRARAKQYRAKPDEFITNGPNQCWCWDVTWLKCPVRGMFYYLYMIVDVFSRKIVGWEVHETECGQLASQLVSRAVMSEGYPACLDVLHADNGSIQKSSTLRATLERLGIAPSYSRPRVSNDNAYSEALFRTTKYRPDYPVGGFESIEKAREWVLKFVRWYNAEHRHSAIKFVTPIQRHTGADVEILAKRDELYKRAKLSNPERWSGETRNWNRPNEVVLNADRPAAEVDEKLKEVA